VVRKYFPNLKDGSLEPGYSGIRPKLSGPGQPPSDFVIQVLSGIIYKKNYDRHLGLYQIQKLIFLMHIHY
jgi:hypothetical protein